MTSELIILTPSAVALAADSAVTIGNEKTYHGVNKLFQLSNDPPMGIMAYNNAVFLNVPIETIIKEFSKSIKELNLSTLDEIKDLLESYLTSIVENSKHKLSFKEQLDLFTESMENNLNYLSIFEMESIIDQEISFHDFNDLGTFLNEIKSKLDEDDIAFENLIPMTFEDNQKQMLIEKLKKFFITSMFLKTDIGIVISGFEKESLFPSLIHLKLIYLWDDKFILKLDEKEEIHDDLVKIKTFAQDDVINTFLTSIDLETQNEIIDFFENMQRNYLDAIKRMVVESTNINESEKIHFFKELQNMEYNLENMIDDFSDFITYLKNYEKQSIYENILYLPYEELSDLVESLINITSLKRKIEGGLETVGGFIDVAIITKGDGFVWVKHKNIFSSELNPQL